MSISSLTWYDGIKTPLYYAANKLSIPTIEFQHGMINSYDFGYIVKKQVKLMNIPKYIFVWGEFFKDLLLKNGTFWSKKNIKVVGYPWLSLNYRNINKLKNSALQKLKLLNIYTNKNILTFTSQGTTQKQLISHFKSITIPDNWIIIIKLHPRETYSFKSVYKDLINKKKLYFVTDTDISIYEILSISKAHASYYSTVLWEAPVFRIENYILDSPFVNLVKEVGDLKLAKIVKLEEIFSSKFIPKKKNINYVFANLQNADEVALNNLLNIHKKNK